LSNFSKEFYHWLVVSGNEAQRICIRFVARGAACGLKRRNQPASFFLQIN